MTFELLILLLLTMFFLLDPIFAGRLINRRSEIRRAGDGLDHSGLVQQEAAKLRLAEKAREKAIRVQQASASDNSNGNDAEVSPSLEQGSGCTPSCIIL